MRTVLAILPGYRTIETPVGIIPKKYTVISATATHKHECQPWMAECLINTLESLSQKHGKSIIDMRNSARHIQQIWYSF